MAKVSAASINSKAKRFENWVLRHEDEIVASLWAAMVVGLLISLYFTYRNPALAVALASTVISIIFGAAGVLVGKKPAMHITLVGILITAGVYVWGFNDLVRPYEHTIAIQGVGMGYTIDSKNCDFSNPKVLACKVP